jgi:hypothetical protein
LSKIRSAQRGTLARFAATFLALDFDLCRALWVVAADLIGFGKARGRVSQPGLRAASAFAATICVGGSSANRPAE